MNLLVQLDDQYKSKQIKMTQKQVIHINNPKLFDLSLKQIRYCESFRFDCQIQAEYPNNFEHFFPIGPSSLPSGLSMDDMACIILIMIFLDCFILQYGNNIV